MDNADFADIDREEPISVANNKPRKYLSLMVSSGTWKIVGIALLMLVLFFLLIFLADKSI